MPPNQVLSKCDGILNHLTLGFVPAPLACEDGGDMLDFNFCI